MKNTTQQSARRSTLAARFRAFRQVAAASVLSATVQAAPAPRLHVMPKIWVAKRAPVAPLDPLDAPLPADFVPAPVAPFESVFVTVDAETEAQIARESAEEIAAEFARIARELIEESAARALSCAVGFVSDYAPSFAPVDFAPDGGAVKVAPSPAIARRSAGKRESFAELAARLLAASGQA